MEAWPSIPEDAIGWLRAVFGEANRAVAERLINVPNIRETSLDDALIEAIVPHSPPHRLVSGAVVEMHIHNIGGLRRMGGWETADIAVIIFVYRGSQLAAQKIGLLQSKRLFPKNNDVISDDAVGFRYGLNGLLHPHATSPLLKLYRQYDFDQLCSYSSLLAGSDQVAGISKFNEEFGEAIYYLLYNPPLIPATVHYPVVTYQNVTQAPLGCRVYAAADVESVLVGMKDGDAPSIGSLDTDKARSNWRLEEWVDFLLRCKVGQQYDQSREQLVGRIIERRSGPIGAAIAVSIALPPD